MRWLATSSTARALSIVPVSSAKAVSSMGWAREFASCSPHAHSASSNPISPGKLAVLINALTRDGIIKIALCALPARLQLGAVTCGESTCLQTAQETIEELANLLDIGGEAMIRIQYVKLTSIFAREADRILYRDDVIAPAVYDADRAFRRHRRVLLVARHVESRRQQKQAACRHVRRDGSGNVRAEARADEYQVARDRLTELQQLLHPSCWIVDPSIVDGCHAQHVATRDLRHRRDLRAPWFAVFAVREDDGSHDWTCEHVTCQ